MNRYIVAHIDKKLLFHPRRPVWAGLEDQALWLLDEPFAGLDQATVDSLADLFTAHLQQGGGLVFSSHDRSLPGARVLQLRPAVDQHQQGEHSAAAERSEADRRV